jgi:transposase
MSNQSIWSQRVDEWRKSGLTAAQFCEVRGFAVGSLRAWSSRLGRKPPVALARVVRSSSSAVAVSRLRVELSGVTLDLPADAEPDFVAALVDAVQRRTSCT